MKKTSIYIKDDANPWRNTILVPMANEERNWAMENDRSSFIY